MSHGCCTLSTPIETPPRRHHLFRTPCTVNGTSCLLAIDSGSEDNLVSQSLVAKLQLPVQQHPRPYPASWLDDDCSKQVTLQCRVPFSIGNYGDSALCDVINMYMCHLILDRPWQFDVDSIYQGKSNTYTFMNDGLKFDFSKKKMMV